MSSTSASLNVVFFTECHNVADDLWMMYDDLKSTPICQFKSPFPAVDRSEVHIVMWRSQPAKLDTCSRNAPTVHSAAVSALAVPIVSVPLTAKLTASTLPIPTVFPATTSFEQPQPIEPLPVLCLRPTVLAGIQKPRAVTVNPLIQPVMPQVPRLRGRRHQLASERQPTVSIPQRPSSTRPRFTNRRYAAVLSHLNRQTGTSLLSSFSGYVPKCKRNDNAVQHENMVVITKGAAICSPEQRKTKVSFCLQTSQNEKLSTKTTSSSSDITRSHSAALSVTSVTVSCTKTLISTTASEVPVTTLSNSELHVADATHLQKPDDCNDMLDSSDISLMCAELFVDNNASFCDQLLDSCSASFGQPHEHNAIPDSLSLSSKYDIPEPIIDFAFDDFDELFLCN